MGTGDPSGLIREACDRAVARNAVELRAGADMAPCVSMPWTVEAPIPVTEVERSEIVNADTLRAALLAGVERIMQHVRAMPTHDSLAASSVVRLAGEDMNMAVQRYLFVEAKFRSRA